MKIEKLTEEQEAMMKVYVDKYIKVGLSTEPIDREKAIAYADKLYAFLNRGKPTVVFADGPLHAWYLTCILNDLQDKDVSKETIEKLQNTKVEDLDISAVKDQIKDFVWPYIDGQFLAGYVAWIEFMKYIGVDFSGINTDIYTEAINLGVIYPLDKYCIISERIKEVHTNTNGLHKDLGCALAYRDGLEIFSLNGVSVPDWLATTPRNKLDAKEFAKIKNVEVRREFIRKVGVEALCQNLGSKVLDKEGDYELHEVDLGEEVGKWPYLKMLNPSIGVWHMECVDRNCKTVKDALNWRNQSELEPEEIT